MFVCLQMACVTWFAIAVVCQTTFMDCSFRVLLNTVVVAMLKGPSGAAWDLSFKKPVVLGISAGFLAIATVLQGLLVAKSREGEPSNGKK